jgi:hypothetical protein
VDGDQLQSDAKLRVKVALQQAGIAPPPTSVMVSVVGHVPVDVAEVDGHARPDATLRPCAIVTAEQAKANLRHDTKAAANGSTLPTNGRHSPLEHAVNQAESHVSDEGENLLEDHKDGD